MSSNEQTNKFIDELLEKIKTQQEELPEWALQIARAHFSEPLHPLRRLFNQWAKTNGEPNNYTGPADNPNYIPDLKEREIRARELAIELVKKYGTEEAAKGPSPLQCLFQEWAHKQMD